MNFLNLGRGDVAKGCTGGVEGGAARLYALSHDYRDVSNCKVKLLILQAFPTLLVIIY